MNSILPTNYSIYESIAREAYQNMKNSIDSQKRPKPDGSEGWIIIYDPTYTSFKSAMVSIVFTGMWLEAILHLEIVRRFNKDKFKDYDFKSYEEKLKLIGIEDIDFLNRISRFRKSRRELVHEKAHFDNAEIKTAESEAYNASEIRKFLIAYLS